MYHDEINMHEIGSANLNVSIKNKVLLSVEILIHYCYGQIPTNQPIIDRNKIFLEDL